MEELKNITRTEMENNFTNQHLITSRIICLTLVAGPLLLIIASLFIFLKNAEPEFYQETTDTSPINVFVYFLIVFTVVDYSLFFYFPKFFLHPKSLKNKIAEIPLKNANLPEKLIFLDRTLMIIRLALLEVVTMFGLVIIFLGITTGEIYYKDYLWLLILPWLFQIVYTMNNYVNREQYINRIEKLFLNRQKYIV